MVLSGGMSHHGKRQRSDTLATLDDMSACDAKALLRRRYGSVRQFQFAFDLPSTGVADLLRGKGSHRVLSALQFAIREDRFRTMMRTPSLAKFQNHCLNEGAE